MPVDLSHTRLLAALDATWPAAEVRDDGGWRLRRGAGGGKRVSAASGSGDVDEAEQAMAAWGQGPLFQLWPGDEALDADLAARGYNVIDPVTIWAAPAAELGGAEDETARVLRMAGPVALAEEIWAAGGVGAARLSVMARAQGPRVWMMLRDGDRPAGCLFAAADGEIAMLHALEIAPDRRRKGIGARGVRAAARWAAENGAATLALAVTQANAPGNALYEGLGMRRVSAYHYRIKDPA